MHSDFTVHSSLKAFRIPDLQPWHCGEGFETESDHHVGETFSERTIVQKIQPADLGGEAGYTMDNNNNSN